MSGSCWVSSFSSGNWTTWGCSHRVRPPEQTLPRAEPLPSRLEDLELTSMVGVYRSWLQLSISWKKFATWGRLAKQVTS